jgi:hypothetical protein
MFAAYQQPIQAALQVARFKNREWRARQTCSAAASGALEATVPMFGFTAAKMWCPASCIASSSSMEFSSINAKLSAAMLKSISSSSFSTYVPSVTFWNCSEYNNNSLEHLMS